MNAIRGGAHRELTDDYRGRIAGRPAGMDDVEGQLWDAELRAWKTASSPGWTPAGRFVGHRATAPLPDWAGIVCMDLDHVADAESVKVKIGALPQVAYAGVSLGGEGVYAGIALSRMPWGRMEYGTVWLFVHAWFRELGYDANVDQHCKEPHRLRFFSHDPDLFVRPAPEPLEIPRPAALKRRVEDLATIAKADAAAVVRDAAQVRGVSWDFSAPARSEPEPVVPIDVETVRGWLANTRFDANDRNEWLSVGYSLKGLALAGHLPDGVAFELWDEWSRTAPKYGQTEETWASFKGAAYSWSSLAPRAGPAPIEAVIGDGSDTGPDEPPAEKIAHRVVAWSVEMGRPVSWGSESHARVQVIGKSTDGDVLVDLRRFIDLTDMGTAARLIGEAMLPVLSTGKFGRDIDVLNRRSLAEILQPLQMSAEAKPLTLDLAERVDGNEDTYSICGLPAPVDGATILFGAGGVSKSQIAVNTAVRIAGDGGRVVMIDTEPFGHRRKRATVQRHLDALEPELRAAALANLTLLSSRSFGHQTVDRLREHCEGAALVVIDSATACVQDEISSSSSAAKFFAFLSELGCPTSLLVAHTAKGAVKAKARDSTPLGSQTWESNSRLTIKVSQPEMSELDEKVRKAVLEVSKSNTPAMVGMKSTATIRFGDEVKVQWLVDGAKTQREEEEEKLAAAVEKVMHELRMVPGPVTTTQLQRYAKMTRRSWGFVRPELLKRGDVKMVKKGSAERWSFIGEGVI